MSPKFINQVTFMKIYLIIGAPALALSACAYDSTHLPVVTTLQLVTNTAVSSSINYQDPFAGYIDRGPIDPRDWRTVNEEQTVGK